MLLHRTYEPSSAIELRSGRYLLVIFTDSEGQPVRVQVTSMGLSEPEASAWYTRSSVMDEDGSFLKHSWDKEDH